MLPCMHDVFVCGRGSGYTCGQKWQKHRAASRTILSATVPVSRHGSMQMAVPCDAGSKPMGKAEVRLAQDGKMATCTCEHVATMLSHLHKPVAARTATRFTVVLDW